MAVYIYPPLSLSTIPPVGGASSANQVLEIAQLTAINANTDGIETLIGTSNTSLSAINTKLPANLTVTSTRLLVDGSGVTQPVSGSVSVSNFPATQPVSGTVAATQSGTWNINNVSGTVSLPTGAATETTLAAINTKTPALGQALNAASVPVVLTATQLTTLTPLTSVTVTQATAANLNATVVGTVTANAGTNLNTSALALESGGNLAGINAKLGSLGQKTMSGSAPVTIASDQAAIATKYPVNPSGTIVNTTLTATTATSNTAPSNAVGFFIEAGSSNSDNIRWAIGSTASASVGSRMEPGRSGDSFVPCSGTVSVCAEASTVSNAYSIQWILSV